MRLSRERFEALAEEALAALPRPFRGRLHNLSIEVRAFPGPEAGRRRSRALMGLYIGLSRAQMLAEPAGALPARILLYQRNIEPGCPDERAVYLALRTTLLHEIAHHFGFSERDIRERWPEGA